MLRLLFNLPISYTILPLFHSNLILPLLKTRKCPLRGHILAPPEGLGDPGFNPSGQEVIPRRFKQKKNFVTHVRTHVRTHRTYGRTDRRHGRNSDVDDLPAVLSCEYFEISVSAKQMLQLSDKIYFYNKKI